MHKINKYIFLAGLKWDENKIKWGSRIQYQSQGAEIWYPKPKPKPKNQNRNIEFWAAIWRERKHWTLRSEYFELFHLPEDSL